MEGTKFKVQTDHNPLRHLRTQPILSRKQANWVLFLQLFDFELEYVKGKLNYVPDAITRDPG